MKYLFILLSTILLISCHRAVFKENWIKEKAPEHFSVSFETSKGFFEAEFTREWSPLAVDRVFAQFKHGFYDNILFYRVKPNYVAQFGVDDSVKRKAWDPYKISDEPVKAVNDRGTISFARAGKDSRDHDLFINLQNNSPRLDTISFYSVKGFPVIGRVTKGMDVVDSLYAGYGDAVFTKYDTLLHDRNAFLKNYPKLDKLKKVRLIHN
jgi:cyclophilin family peptidyl-prolyl cis-trans isomerase